MGRPDECGHTPEQHEQMRLDLLRIGDQRAGYTPKSYNDGVGPARTMALHEALQLLGLTEFTRRLEQHWLEPAARGEETPDLPATLLP